jgi:hypothetical protein
MLLQLRDWGVELLLRRFNTLLLRIRLTAVHASVATVCFQQHHCNKTLGSENR